MIELRSEKFQYKDRGLAESDPRSPVSCAPQLCLLGISFRAAPVAIRESLSFSDGQAKSFLENFAKRNPKTELLLLSTCNRTEFYLSAEDHALALKQLLDSLKRLRPEASVFHFECKLYQKTGSDVAAHLFRVSSGLDSAILGDGQILGQVKNAMRLSSEVGALGSCLHETLSQAMRVAKRSRGETDIGRGNAGLGSAIAALLAQRIREEKHGLDKPQALIIGAGKIAREIGRHLSKRAICDLMFINRNEQRAERVADYCGGQVEGWSALPAALEKADFIIAATSCPKPILTESLVSRLSSERRRLYIDVGVPRNIDSLSREEALDIDAIRDCQEEALALRMAAAPKVESMIQDETEIWIRNMKARPLERMLKTLFIEGRAASRDLAASLAEKLTLDCEETEALLNRTIEAMLGRHARQMRHWTRYRETSVGGRT